MCFEDLPGNMQINALSDQLVSLEPLWETLSQCLLELEHTPDHHAVLVLQVFKINIFCIMVFMFEILACC